MNLKELKEMIELMHQNGLSELEIEKNGFKVRLKKGSGGFEVRSSGSEPRVVSLPEVSSSTSQQAPKAPKEPENVVIIRSPMVGTFYAAPSPEKDPYVSNGKEIKEGDVLCIVEAMKLMNEIKSEVRGRVVEVLAANGQPVEFDQPLFKIQKI